MCCKTTTTPSSSTTTNSLGSPGRLYTSCTNDSAIGFSLYGTTRVMQLPVSFRYPGPEDWVNGTVPGLALGCVGQSYYSDQQLEANLTMNSEQYCWQVNSVVLKLQSKFL